MTSVKQSLQIALVAGLISLIGLVGRSASAQTIRPSVITTPTHKIYSTGSGTFAWWITQLGLGSAGEYQINNANNSSTALIVTTNGSGDAGDFTASGNGYGVYAQSANNYAVYGICTSSNADGGHFVANGSGNGVVGVSGSGYGGNFSSNGSGIGVYGESHSGDGGYFIADGSGSGLYATSSSGWAGYFAGKVTADYYYYNSDARYKQNVRTLPHALDTVLALRGVSFDWRQNEFPQMHFSKTHQLGFIAQEVEKVVPELVSKDGKGMRSLDYIRVIPILVEAIKQQQQQIQASKAQIETLKAQNKQLISMQAQLTSLTAQLAKMQQNLPARTATGQTIAHK